MKPNACSSGVSAWPSTTIAPIRTMPWMKLLPDISGVCRMTGTREMITWPAIAASMKMYNATKPSPTVFLPFHLFPARPHHNHVADRRAGVNPCRCRAFLSLQTCLHPCFEEREDEITDGDVRVVGASAAGIAVIERLAPRG